MDWLMNNETHRIPSQFLFQYTWFAFLGEEIKQGKAREDF